MPLEKLMLAVALLLQLVGGSSVEADIDSQKLEDEKAAEAYRMVLHSVKLEDEKAAEAYRMVHSVKLQDEKAAEAYRMVLHSVKEPQTGQCLKPVA
jgi:preprotein translocase subunit SecD